MAGSGAFVGPHTFNQGAWHNCMRCDIKTKIAAMQWQRGLLLCSTCWDPWPLEGQREQGIAQVLMDGKVDFDIAEKLKDPVVDTDDMLLF
jgi:hypothetical protein